MIHEGLIFEQKMLSLPFFKICPLKEYENINKDHSGRFHTPGRYTVYDTTTQLQDVLHITINHDTHSYRGQPHIGPWGETKLKKNYPVIMLLYSATGDQRTTIHSANTKWLHVQMNFPIGHQVRGIVPMIAIRRAATGAFQH